MSKNCKHEWLPLGNDRWSCKHCATVKVGYVAELEHQLAEKDDFIKTLGFKNEDKFREYVLNCLLNKEDKVNTIRELENQLAECKEKLEESFCQEDVEGLIKDRDSMINYLKQQLTDKDKIIEELLEKQSLLNRDNIVIVKQLDDPTCYVSLEEYEQKLSKKDKEIERLKEEICKYEITLMERNSQLKDQCHQICEKIRNDISELLGVDASAWDEMNDEYYTGITICCVAQVLDRIEKGE